MVRLEFDAERKDRFGRTLAYVYLPDATFLNAEIVKQGYGHAYTQFPFRYLEQFRVYEQVSIGRIDGRLGHLAALEFSGLQNSLKDDQADHDTEAEEGK